jgi:hypothetical protein
VAHKGTENGEGRRQKGEGYVSRGLLVFRNDLFSPQVHVLQIFKCSSDETSLSNPLS